VIHLSTTSKINLFLHIHGTREDGRHELTTLFQAIDYGDELWAEPADEIEFSCPDAEAGPEEENLVLRAARLLREAADIRSGARLRLEKHVPVGAGLGGGSGDAAATLLACARLWGLDWSRERLAQLAVQLGADIPFLVHGGAAWAEGIGEKLTACPGLSSETEILVLTPPEAVSTGWAYRVWDEAYPHGLPNDPRISILRSLSGQGSFQKDELQGLLWNSFEPVVFAKHPGIAQLGKEMVSAGASTALLSGSGSSVFGLFPSREISGDLEAAWRRRGVRMRWCRPMPVRPADGL
jgi:4-diphosphocytidyl-2-C-methyl-D-erythritol kinase